MDDVLKALEGWYADHCDGDWEHQCGLRIDTLDNPGWSVDIDLAGTALAGRVLVGRLEERSEDDWVVCSVESDVFRGRGGPRNLREILNRFLGWSGGVNPGGG